MSAPLRQPPSEAAEEPSGFRPDNLVKGTALSRLAQAFRNAPRPGEDPDGGFTFSSSPAEVVGGGVPNPYGRGLAAYEPNTVIFSDYATAYSQVQASKAEEAQGELVELDFSQPDFAGGGLVEATGRVQSMVSAAMNLASRRVSYVWGGTTANGVDCSGLIFYAARAAGIDWQRYRAVDYGRMGTAVSLAQARPGDVVYYDNPGDVDHVGIYIGNGQMVQAPQSGDVVRVTGVGNFTSIRRVFSDGAFTAGATPTGGATPLYNGRSYTPTLSPLVPGAPAPPTISRSYRRPF